MADSGQGGSWNSTFTQCMRKGFHAHVQRLTPAESAPSAALIVGEAVHTYAQALYEAQLLGAPPESCKENAELAFALAPGMINLDGDPYLAERVKLARQVLPVWAEGQLARLEAGVERTIAVEVSFSYRLPAETPYGPIRENLRLVTGRIDRVFRRSDPLELERLGALGLTIQDHKATKASSLTYYVRDLLRSDQHLGYVFGWNLNRGWQLTDIDVSDYHLDMRAHEMEAFQREGMTPADEIEYNLIRLHSTLNAKSLHREARPTNTEQLLDYYERLCALRAHLSMMWEKPINHWYQNTAACYDWNTQCPYWRLCEEPHLHPNLIAPGEEYEGYAYRHATQSSS